MAQTLAKIYIHATFHIGIRSPQIPDETSPKLYAYIGGVISRNNCLPIEINGTGDHLHILFSLHPSIDLSKLIQTIKTASNKWMKENGCRQFKWQNGYGAFSVSASVLDAAAKYIRNQRIHHKKCSYYDELGAFCKVYGIEMNEEYVMSE